MEDNETIETINLTEPGQINENPPIESIPDAAPVTDPIERAPEEPETDPEPGVEDETLADVPAPQANIQGSIDELNARIDRVFETLDKITAVLDNINNLENARAAGPQGFFKPIEDGRGETSPDSSLPRIEKIYK